MSKQGIAVFVCSHALGAGQSAASLEDVAGETTGGEQVRIQSVPCSGKVDLVYVLRAFEGGMRGMALITCPPENCRNVEGAYRAAVRMNHAARLLDEVGLGSKRLVILHGRKDAEGRDVPALMKEAVKRLAALPPNPVAKPVEPARMERK